MTNFEKATMLATVFALKFYGKIKPLAEEEKIIVILPNSNLSTALEARTVEIMMQKETKEKWKVKFENTCGVHLNIFSKE